LKQPTIAICAGLLMLGVAAPLPATAQVYPDYRAYPVHPGYAVMPPYEVMAIVRSTGMRPLGRPLRHGPLYVVVALDPNGQEMQVMVDARSGRIMRVGSTLAPRYAAPAPYGRPPRGIPMLPDDYDPRADQRMADLPPAADAPPGPGMRPGVRLPGPGPGAGYDAPPPAPAGRAPAAQAPAATAQSGGPPPLPRPRPRVASADTSNAAPTPPKPATAAAPQAVPQMTATEAKNPVTTGAVAVPAGAVPPPAEIYEMHE
jgi:hypothetical protein